MVVESLQPAVHSTVVMDNQAGFLAKVCVVLCGLFLFVVYQV